MSFKVLRNGFALVEVMLSITVIGLVLTTLLVLQATVFRKVVINTFRIDRLYPLKAFLMQIAMDTPKKDQKRIEKTHELSDMKMTYEHASLKKNSALSRFEGLYQKKVAGSWMEQNKQRTLELITYGFNPREKKSDE